MSFSLRTQRDISLLLCRQILLLTPPLGAEGWAGFGIPIGHPIFKHENFSFFFRCPIVISPAISQQYQRLHKKSIVVDTHNDILSTALKKT